MELERLLIYVAIYVGMFSSVFLLVTFLEKRNGLKNPEVKRFAKVTVAVSMYNAGNHLNRTIESLLALDWPEDKLEVIIIDDGSEDNSYEQAKEYLKDPRVTLLRQQNMGKATAINRALRQSTGEFFGVLDVDAFVEKDCLKKMMGYFENENVMAVTPSLKIYGDTKWLQRIQRIEYLIGVYLRKVFSYIGSIHVTPGCFSIYRKAFFQKTGPYDERNLTEDIEAALRIQSADYTIENSINANVYTTAHKNMKSLYQQRIRWYKGFIDNVISYKRLFSSKFGNLGVFILPMAFVSVMMAIALSAYVITKLSLRLLNDYHILRSTGFDLTQYLKINFDFFYFNLNAIFILGTTSLILSLFSLYLVKKHSEEKKPVVASFVIFLFTYIYLYAFWWISAIYCKVSGKKIRWGNKYL